MGPAQDVMNDKNGTKQYLVISYRRGGAIHRLKVPLHYSSYYGRSPMFFQHPYGKLGFQIDDYLHIGLFLIFTFRSILPPRVFQVSACLPNCKHRPRKFFGECQCQSTLLSNFFLCGATSQLVLLP